MYVLSLFDGISCGREALRQAGVKVTKYFASEIDPAAVRVAMSRHPDTVQLGCVKTVRVEDNKIVSEKGTFDCPRVDLLLVGSPCQGFSACGQHEGLDHPESSLLLTALEILKAAQPRYYLFENVKLRGPVLDLMPGKPVTIDSRLYAAQKRLRMYWSNLPRPLPPRRVRTLAQIVPGCRGIFMRPRKRHRGGVRLWNHCNTVCASGWDRNNFAYCPDNRTRPYNTTALRAFEKLYGKTDLPPRSLVKFTPGEVEQLQELPVGYTSILRNKSKRISLVGKGWTVSVIAAWLKYLK